MFRLNISQLDSGNPARVGDCSAILGGSLARVDVSQARLRDSEARVDEKPSINRWQLRNDRW